MKAALNAKERAVAPIKSFTRNRVVALRGNCSSTEMATDWRGQRKLSWRIAEDKQRRAEGDLDGGGETSWSIRQKGYKHILQ